MRLSFLQKQAAREIIAATLQEIKTNKRAAAITFDDLHARLSGQARELSVQLQAFNPAHYGINRQTVTPIPSRELVVVSGQSHTNANGRFPIPSRLVPRHTFRAFQAMNHSLKKDIGRSLVIQSGYRSPAYQLFVFLFQCKANGWNVEKTLETVNLPGYSEHAHGEAPALDLRAEHFMGPETAYDFSRLPSYRWLTENAHEFGFSLSYPEGNEAGVRFEPWHWRHSHGAF